MNIPWDVVQLKITEHELVMTETVRVNVRATVSVASEDASKASSMLTGVLGSIIDAKWEISKLLRSEDDTGMERLIAVATVRVPEAASLGLVGRLHGASRSGLKLELASIEHRAPRATLDAATRRLRVRVYERAVEEATLLNQTMPDPACRWRVGEISLTSRVDDNRAEERQPRSMEGLSSSARFHNRSSLAEGPSEDEPLSVGNRVVVEATVTIKRPSVTLPQDGPFGHSNAPE